MPGGSEPPILEVNSRIRRTPPKDARKDGHSQAAASKSTAVLRGLAPLVPGAR